MKRIFDILVSLIGILVSLPFLLVLFILIWIKLGWPVFFTQQRPGLNAIPFKMVKFRTMTNERDSQGKLLADHLRVTGLGRFIRKSSLDELPELFNVLKGDMSIVGPRPLLVKYLPFYTEREQKRHKVRPGITGLAQVNGRNLLSWDKRLEMDVKYVETLSIWMDMRIIFLTAVQVIRRRDVLAVSSETIPDFDDFRKDQMGKGTHEN
ncbi:MAG: sugar transferase [Bacteroidia bacterium]|nr:MAG: sugar transferase [Bacteroidia bacterium]